MAGDPLQVVTGHMVTEMSHTEILYVDEDTDTGSVIVLLVRGVVSAWTGDQINDLRMSTSELQRILGQTRLMCIDTQLVDLLCSRRWPDFQ